MKKILYVFIFLFPVVAGAQTIVKNAALTYTAGVPTHTPDATRASEYCVDTVTMKLYWRNRTTSSWVLLGQGIDVVVGGSAPVYTPTKNQSVYAISTISGGDSLYYYRSGAWRHINKGAGVGVTDGDKGDIVVSGTGTVWRVDTGVINTSELSWTLRDSLQAARCSTQVFSAFSGTTATFTALADATEIRQVTRGGLVQTLGTNYTVAALVVTFSPAVVAQDVLITGCTAGGEAIGGGGTGTVTSVATGSGLTGGPITSTGTVSIATGGVTTTHLADSTIATVDIAGNAVTTAKIANGAVTGSKMGQDAATSGQVWKWNGTKWAPAADDTGGGGVSDGDKGDITVSGSGATWNIDADAVGSSEIATDAVSSAEIATDAVGGAEIAADAVGASELAATTVTAGSYGSSTKTLSITTDADGRLTAASENTISFSQDTTFSTAGTFTVTVPSWARSIVLVGIGSGGGGGSGRKGAAGSVRCGGGGGKGGAYSEITISEENNNGLIAALGGSTITVVVTAGGAGGTAQSTNSTNGNAGTAGTSTTIAVGSVYFLEAGGGAAGSGGTNSAGAGGSSTTTVADIQGSAGGSASGTGGTGSGGTDSGTKSPSGGGGGGGITSGDATSAGGSGGDSYYRRITSVNRGTAGNSGTAGAAPANSQAGGGQGGGGGGSSTAGNAGNGGNGTRGGGGGGGGAALDSVGNSGTGGDGGAGWARIIFRA